MIDSQYRKPYQKYFLDSIANHTIIRSLSPTLITCLGLCIGIIIPISLFYHRSFLAIFFLLLSGFLDTLDGTLARKQEKSSPKGALLDILSDRIVESAIIIGLYLYDTESRAIYALGMLAASYLCVTSFLTVGIFTQNDGTKSFHYSPGLMERTEAFFFYLLMILLPSQFFWLAITYILLVSITALIRTVEFTHR